MEQLVNAVMGLLARNRRRLPKYWEKVWVHRLEKLLPDGTDTEAFLTVFLADNRVKLVQKQDDHGTLLPAVQLRFEAYQSVLKSSH